MRLVKFDQHECIDLLSLLKIMGSMSQEQIWAIFYFTAQQLNKRRKKKKTKQASNTTQHPTTTPSTTANNNINKQAELARTNEKDNDESDVELPFKPIDGLSHIYIHKLGFVHAKTRAFWRHMFAGEQLDGSEIERDINEDEETVDVDCTNDVDDGHNDGQAHDTTSKTTSSSHKCQSSNNNNNSSVDLSNRNNSNKTTTNYLISDEHYRNDDDCEEYDDDNDDASTDDRDNRCVAFIERRLVSNLCLAIYLALDHGVADDEERKIDANLEQLIYASQAEDEQRLSLAQVQQTCVARVSHTSAIVERHRAESTKTSSSSSLSTSAKKETSQTPTHHHTSPASRQTANKHYTTVLRSLVDDYVQLSNFLHKIYKASVSLNDANLSYLQDRTGAAGQSVGELANCNVEELRRLGLSVEPLGSKLESVNFNSWARLWMHVIRELRQRVKHKQLASTVTTPTSDGKSSSSSSMQTDDELDEEDEEDVVDIELDDDDDDEFTETSSASTSASTTIRRKIAATVASASAAKSSEHLQLTAH